MFSGDCVGHFTFSEAMLKQTQKRLYLLNNGIVLISSNEPSLAPPTVCWFLSCPAVTAATSMAALSVSQAPGLRVPRAYSYVTQEPFKC